MNQNILTHINLKLFLSLIPFKIPFYIVNKKFCFDKEIVYSFGNEQGIFINKNCEGYVVRMNGKNIISDCFCKNGRIVGLHISYSNSGEVIMIQYLNNNTNFYISFFSNCYKSIGMFKNGMHDNLWIFYFYNGVISEEEFFINGKKNGLFINNDSYNNTIAIGFLMNDEKVGIWYEYDFDGNETITKYSQIS